MKPELDSLGSVSGAVLGVALVLAAAFGVGGPIVRREGGEGWRKSDRLLLQFAVGMNLVGMIAVVLGQLRFLGGRNSLWLLVGLAALGAVELWRWRREWKSAATKRPNRPQPLPWCSWMAAIALLVTLGPALCYPTGWDELVYHYELPRRWRADGWPAFYADLPYSGFPSLGEILFWLAAPLEGVIAPRLLCWICWIISLVLLYRVLRRRLASESAALLTLVFALSTTMLMITANCFVETIQAMNVAGLLLAISLPGRLGKGRWRAPPVILGILAGGATAVKLTGGAVLVAPALWYLGEAWHDSHRRLSALRSLGLYFAVAVVVCLPFYLRPWLATGDPCYPYFAHWFSADAARLEMSRYHHAIGAAFGVKGVPAFLTSPVLMAMNELLYDGSFGWQLPLCIALAAVAITAAIRRGRWEHILWPATISLWLYSCWFFTAQQARFAVPAMLAVMTLAATGLHGLRGKHRRWALALLLMATATSLPWRTAGHYVGSWMAVQGVVSATDYVDIGTGTTRDRYYLPLIRAIREQTPQDARLMLLFEHRGFYVPRPYIIGTPFFQEAGFTPPERFGDAGRVMALFSRERISHVLISKFADGPDRLADWIDRVEPLDAALIECQKTGRLHLIWESDRYLLLEVRQSTAPAVSQ